MEIFFKPQYIYLYNEPSSQTLYISEIAEYLRKKLKDIKVEIRDDFLRFHIKGKENSFITKLAKELARCKIVQPSVFTAQQIENYKPLLMEVEYEKKKIENPENKSFGIIYNGFLLNKILYHLLSNEEKSFNHLHIIFTNQLFGTHSEDGRFHLRVSIYGLPCIISTSGIVTAPAKPKEYYLIKNLGKKELLINWKEENKGEFIDFDDGRLTDVLKGYALQSLFFYLIGNPFCNDKGCRLFNAHWQKELIFAQINSPYELCSFHQNILDKQNEGV